MKKVLIALDYDPYAKKIAEWGHLLAKTMNAKVILLHVIADETYYATVEYSPIMGFGGFSSANFLELVDDAGPIKASQYFLGKFKHHLHDDNIETIIEKGDFADTILDSAKRLHADIIVMGSHSRKWLEKVLVGSVTEKVLRHTSIPLFIVPIKNEDDSTK